MKFNFHTWATILLLALCTYGFGVYIGWREGDGAAIWTRIIYVFIFWTLTSLYAFIYNGIFYNTWSVVNNDHSTSGRVLSAIIIGTAFIVGRPF